MQLRDCNGDGEWSVDGIARGFRAPNLRQTEAGYCMSTGGSSPRRGSLRGNPQLRSEQSTS